MYMYIDLLSYVHVHACVDGFQLVSHPIQNIKVTLIFVLLFSLFCTISLVCSKMNNITSELALIQIIFHTKVCSY